MVAVVVQSDVTEAIPLLNNNGSGVYIAGRNTATEFRNYLLGGMFGKVNWPFTYRPGVLNPSVFPAGGVVGDCQVASTGGAGTQAVTVAVGRMAIPRAAQGVYLVTNAGSTNVPAPAADGSNPRIDILAVMPYDIGSFPGDAQHGPKYIWITGDPAGSPTVPAIPVAVQECLPLARILRGVGDNTIASGDITDLRKGASLMDTPRTLMAGDLLADAGLYHGEKRRRQISHIDSVYTNAGYTLLEDRWDSLNATWRGTQTLHLPKPTLATTASLGGGGTFTMGTISLPDPGWPYRIDVAGSLLYQIVGGASTSLKDVYIQFNIDEAAFVPTPDTRIINRGASATTPSPAIIRCGGRYSTTLTGAHTVYFILRNDSSPSNFVTWDGNNAYASCSVDVIPA